MLNDNLSVLSTIFGWTYFLCWSASFYPQVILNHQRKSVAGLSLDFQTANVTGFAFYSIYTLASVISQEVYSLAAVVTVNDLAFALHAFILTLFTLCQAALYSKNTLSVSLTRAHLSSIGSTSALLPVLVTLTVTGEVDNKVQSVTYEELQGEGDDNTNHVSASVDDHHDHDNDNHVSTAATLSSASCQPPVTVIENSTTICLSETTANVCSVNNDLSSPFINSTSTSLLSASSASSSDFFSFFSSLLSRINPFLSLLIVTLWSLAVYNCLLSLTHFLPWVKMKNVNDDNNNDTSYNTVQYFGYGKLVMTLVKYVPQAYMNYSLKSTVGWSIVNVLLDITGGVLSLSQQCLDSIVSSDWSLMYGNVPKLFLAVETVVFDCLFIIQHYILYRKDTNCNEARAKT